MCMKLSSCCHSTVYTMCMRFCSCCNSTLSRGCSAPTQIRVNTAMTLSQSACLYVSMHVIKCVWSCVGVWVCVCRVVAEVTQEKTWSSGNLYSGGLQWDIWGPLRMGRTGEEVLTSSTPYH